MKELIELLESVSDTYPAFVHGVSGVCKRNPEVLEDIKRYIKDNKDADSSDITDKLYDMIEDVRKIDPNAYRIK